ncbi:hypothetical protein [Glutamicibacter mysorens]|uniref:hypothetical protein n=1 Tax=Glutamicibacter mysorens TaxID=257984 RepID=UPI0020C70F30|nr:hypothetical protein [Glutamicibacter mysorens]UTM45921.1 hypothetical protein XH9_10080 [Glutamicibacter mysorens]
MRKQTNVSKLLNVETILEELWFGRNNHKDPVYLGIEDEFLKSEGIDPLDFASAIGRKVLEELDLNKPKDIFYSLTKKLSAWTTGSQETAPPVLSIIGASILAAQNMHGDMKYSANAYYPRLAEVLDGEVPSEQLRSCYDDVVTMWLALHSWIQKNSALGPSTIASLGGHVKIGYARSQATITARDRALLSSIKTKIGHEIFESSTDGELLNEIKIRSSSISGPRFSPAFRAAIAVADAEIEGFLLLALRSAPILEHGGSSHQRVMACAELWYEFDTEEFSWVVPKNHELSEFVGKDSIGHEIQVCPSHVSEIWETTSMPSVSAESLVTERTWTDEERSIKISSRAYWIFQDVSSNDAVMSSRLPVDGERFSLLIPSSTIDALVASNPLDLSELNYQPNVFNGWDFYADISSNDNPKLLDLLNASKLNSNNNTLNSKYQLSGGLSVRSFTGKKGFLEGYEPEMIADRSAGFYTLVLDGDKTQSRLRATGHPLPISSVSSGAGLRRVEVPGQLDETYHVLSTREAWSFSRVEVEEQAVLLPRLDNKYLGRRDRYYFAISEDGRITDVSYCGQPTWLKMRSKVSKSEEYVTDFQYFVVQIPGDCVWLVGLHETRVPVVERIEKRGMRIDNAKVKESAYVWRTFFDLLPIDGIADLDILILMVKGICK